VAQNSLGRLPTADELAWAVEMLLAPEASILHGSVLYLDAGGHRGITDRRRRDGNPAR
jgi:hypothetical protein